MVQSSESHSLSLLILNNEITNNIQVIVIIMAILTVYDNDSRTNVFVQYHGYPKKHIIINSIIFTKTKVHK